MAVVVPAQPRPSRPSRDVSASQVSSAALASVVVMLLAFAPADAHAAPPKRASASAPLAPRTPRTPRVESAAARGATAATATSKPAAKAKPNPKRPPPPCFHDAAFVQRGSEGALFALTRCDGTPAPLAVEHLSVLARPNIAALPPVNLSALARKPTADLAPGVRRMDGRLVERLQAVVDHFAGGAKGPHGAKGAAAAPRARIVLVSGYRPASVGSFHAHGRALDFRLEGVANEELVAFCKTLRDTGCGYYPNSSFVHLDVREPGTGHVEWIDGSGPGESPHYVASWPPPPSSSVGRAANKGAAGAVAPFDKLDPEAAPTAIDEHPSLPTMSATALDDAAEAAGESDADPAPLPPFEGAQNANDDAPSEAAPSLP